MFERWAPSLAIEPQGGVYDNLNTKKAGQSLVVESLRDAFS